MKEKKNIPELSSIMVAMAIFLHYEPTNSKQKKLNFNIHIFCILYFFRCKFITLTCVIKRESRSRIRPIGNEAHLRQTLDEETGLFIYLFIYLFKKIKEI